MRENNVLIKSLGITVSKSKVMILAKIVSGFVDNLTFNKIVSKSKIPIGAITGQIISWK